MIEVIQQAIHNLKREGLRTFLTLIGIVIGIAAIVSLISVGNGLNLYFEEQFESIGSNSVFVIPGDSITGSQNDTITITERDLDYIKSLTRVETVIAEYASYSPIEFNGQKKNILLFSADEEGYNFFRETNYVELLSGRFVESNELSTVMIDETLAEKVFDRKINLRKQIIINNENYTVVGIFKFSVNMSGMMPGSGMALVSFKGFERIYSVTGPVEMIVKTRTTDDAPFVAEQIKEYFEKKYGKRSVTILTSDQTIDLFGSVLSILTLVLAGIAGISLVVGGIGIMNAMITSVLERTKEIGLLKALGASNNKILTLFILESALIGLIGGIIGATMGFVLGAIISVIGEQAGLPLKVNFNLELLIGALIFSMIVGMLSGAYPAYRASKLDPVEALRYE